jgi:raffinose/stachyose/melibiose transport system permease protein
LLSRDLSPGQTLSGRPGGFPRDQLGGELDPPGGQRPVLDELAEHLRGCPAHLGQRLAHRGQRRRDPAGDRQVVEADHAQVLRDPQPALPRRLVDAQRLLVVAGLGRYLVNSAILTAVCVVLTLTICLGAAFRIVRRSSRAAVASFRVLLLGLAIPLQAIIVPLYLLVYKLHLYDTLFALMLTMSAAAVPLSVLVMVSFVRDIPRELIGAMLVDGGTEWTVFRRLIVPLSTPVLATLAIYTGLDVWNNFILPLVLTQSNSVAVLPLGLTKLEGQYAINVPAVMAAVLLSVLPLVVLFIVMRKQVMRSLGSVVMR